MIEFGLVVSTTRLKTIKPMNYGERNLRPYGFRQACRYESELDPGLLVCGTL